MPVVLSGLAAPLELRWWMGTDGVELVLEGGTGEG
jgi:hypothetical protein